MQDLHADLAIVLMHRISDLLVTSNIFLCNQFLGIRVSTALSVGANTTCHYKPYTAFGALTKVGSHALMAIRHFFEASVH